jgi:hypothetical protein
VSLYYAGTSAVIKLLVEAPTNEPDRGMRSLAAIHLATARVLAPELDAVITYDDRLLRAAGDAGLVTLSPRDGLGPGCGYAPAAIALLVLASDRERGDDSGRDVRP